MTVDRKSGPKKLIHVPRASASVAGGIQPGALKAALGGRYQADGPEAMEKQPREHFENGLAARLLPAYPPRLPKQWTEADVSGETTREYEAVFDRLFQLASRRDENGDPEPIDLPLTANAKETWVRFYNEHAREQCELGEDLSAAWSKLEGYSARFALIIHLVRVAAGDKTVSDPDAVDDLSMRAGITLSRWFGDEAARVYEELGAQGDSAENLERRRLLRIIRDHGGEITTRELMRASRHYRESAETAEAALDGLAHDGDGQWIPRPAGEQGGRPGRALRLVEHRDGDTTAKDQTHGEDLSPSPHRGDDAASGSPGQGVAGECQFAVQGRNLTTDEGDGNKTPALAGIPDVSSPLPGPSGQDTSHVESRSSLACGGDGDESQERNGKPQDLSPEPQDDRPARIEATL